MLSPMEKIVGNLAVCNVLITHVTDLQDDVFLVVKMDFMVNFVIEVMIILDFWFYFSTSQICFLCDFFYKRHLFYQIICCLVPPWNTITLNFIIMPLKTCFDLRFYKSINSFYQHMIFIKMIEIGYKSVFKWK